MNQNILVKDYLKNNTASMNMLLSKFILIFVILCPAFVITNQTGITSYETDTMLKVCLVIFVLSVLPAIACHYSYNDTLNRCLCLSCLEILICIFSLNGFIEINIIFTIVPIVSLLYISKDTLLHTARNCFFAMALFKVAQVYEMFHYSGLLASAYVYQYNYMSLVGLVLEYLLVMVVLYFLGSRMIEMVSSGYLLEKREDGSYATRAAVLQEEAIVQEYDTKGIFLEIDQTIHNLIRGKDKTFSLNVDYGLPTKLAGDTEKIRFAMVNLLSDLVQYTEHGNVSLEVTYEKGIVPKKDQNITMICRLVCSEDLSEALCGGNALGFALAKNMILKMNGLLLDKSVTGEDAHTRYVISLQQVVKNEETILQAKQQNREEQRELISDSRKKAQDILLAKQVHALVVDDSKANQKLVSSILKSYGMNASCVSTGDAAIEKIKSKNFDFVIIDHMMPVKGGIQTAKEIRQMSDPYFELLPLVAMTSNITEESKQMFFDQGFAEVISKPIKEDELRQAMSHCMFL